jgi:hypothetical protein
VLTSHISTEATCRADRGMHVFRGHRGRIWFEPITIRCAARSRFYVSLIPAPHNACSEPSYIIHRRHRRLRSDESRNLLSLSTGVIPPASRKTHLYSFGRARLGCTTGQPHHEIRNSRIKSGAVKARAGMKLVADIRWNMIQLLPERMSWWCEMYNV